MTKNRRADYLAAAKVKIVGGADGPPLPKQPRRPTPPKLRPRVAAVTLRYYKPAAQQG